jgi:hypothetical protein
MEFFFPEDMLNRMTPEETHITSLTAEPYPDGRRLRVNIEITPFRRSRTSGHAQRCRNEEVASASVVEPMSWKLEFTLPARELDPTRLARIFLSRTFRRTRTVTFSEAPRRRACFA